MSNSINALRSLPILLLTLKDAKCIFQFNSVLLGSKRERKTAVLKSFEKVKKTLWFVQLEGSEFGPFSQTELESIVFKSHLKSSFYVWHRKMKNWLPASSAPELLHIFQYSSNKLKIQRDHSLGVSSDPLKKNARLTKRNALIATVSVLTSPKTSFLVGVCEDISAHGMQVIIDAQHEIKKGCKLTLKIDPLGLTKIPAFTVSGVVIWHSPEQKRFGFSFVDMTSAARTSLQKYLAVEKNKDITRLTKSIRIRFHP